MIFPCDHTNGNLPRPPHHTDDNSPRLDTEQASSGTTEVAAAIALLLVAGRRFTTWNPVPRHSGQSHKPRDPAECWVRLFRGVRALLATLSTDNARPPPEDVGFAGGTSPGGRRRLASTCPPLIMTETFSGAALSIAGASDEVNVGWIDEEVPMSRCWVHTG
jgi:hypothetical protein